MLAVAYFTQNVSRRVKYNVCTFDLPSRTCLGPLLVPDGRFVSPIWTHDEYLRFAIIYPGSITIWEVEFVLKHPPKKVESFPIPDEVVHGYKFLFLPILYRLAFTLRGTIHILDVNASKLLLKSDHIFSSYPRHPFSSDGRFFISSTATGKVYIWKESPAGYTLHQQLPSLFYSLEELFLSPNGRSIIFTLDGTINLWHTGDQTLSPPSPPTEEHRLQHHFLLAFSPNEKSAAFAQLYGTVVTVLDLRSGDLRLSINTGMRVECVGVAGDTVVVVDEGKIVTWNLPGGDSIRTVTLDGRSLKSLYLSPDLSRIAAITNGKRTVRFYDLVIYDVPTGKCLASAESGSFNSPCFTRDGQEVWMTHRAARTNDGREIIEGCVSGAMELKPLKKTLYPSRTFLWDSICGYKVTDDGWVLSPTRQRLLWLPHRWRSDQRYRLWSGRFLGLTHRLLSEVVILEFFE